MQKRIVSIVGVLIRAVLGVCLPAAADWPAYRHDNERSGVTTEPLTLPLSQQWAFYPPYAPNPAWPDPALENAYGGNKGRLFVALMTFDRAHQLVASGGMVYFSSSADHKVYCLDAATAEIKWAFHTEGPSAWRRRFLPGNSTSVLTTDGSIAWTRARAS